MSVPTDGGPEPRRRRRLPWKPRDAASPDAGADEPSAPVAPPADREEAVEDVDAVPTPPRSKLARAAAFGATVVKHRDLLVQALELLRRARAISAEEEAKITAAYEEGSPPDRLRLSELVDRLQEANLGEVIIGLARRAQGGGHAGASHLLEEGKRALAEAGHRLRREGQRLLGTEGKLDVAQGEELLRTGRKALRSETRALAREGRRLARDYRAELQAFLEENQPTVEAVERVSADLASAGRELAASLKFAGREAADELLKHGRKVITGFETADLEQALLDEAIATLPRVRYSVNRVLRWFGLFFLAMSVVMLTVWYPPLTPFALSGAGLLLLLIAVVVLGWKKDLNRSLRDAEHGLRQIEALPAGERRRRIVQHARQALASAPRDVEDASAAAEAGPIPVPLPPPVPASLEPRASPKRRRTQRGA